jgi:hypothetical protein
MEDYTTTRNYSNALLFELYFRAADLSHTANDYDKEAQYREKIADISGVKFSD